MLAWVQILLALGLAVLSRGFPPHEGLPSPYLPSSVQPASCSGPTGSTNLPVAPLRISTSLSATDFRPPAASPAEASPSLLVASHSLTAARTLPVAQNKSSALLRALRDLCVHSVLQRECADSNPPATPTPFAYR